MIRSPAVQLLSDSMVLDTVRVPFFPTSGKETSLLALEGAIQGNQTAVKFAENRKPIKDH